jgi:hypothetical protein
LPHESLAIKSPPASETIGLSAMVPWICGQHGSLGNRYRLVLRSNSCEASQILPKVLALGAQLIMLVAAGDRMPELNVEPVCKGIAE